MVPNGPSLMVAIVMITAEKFKDRKSESSLYKLSTAILPPLHHAGVLSQVPNMRMVTYVP